MKDSKQASRRRFLKESTALAGMAVGIGAAGLEAVGVGSAGVGTVGAQSETIGDVNALGRVLYGERSRFVKTIRVLEGSDDPHGSGHGPVPDPYRPGSRTPLRDLTGIITPSSLHYTTQHLYGIPNINPSEHQLMIHGLVDRPLVFSVEELRRLPSVSRIYFIECIGNRPTARAKTVDEGHGRTACSEWTGVPLSLLLQEAGIQKGASWIIAEGSEGGKHHKSVPMAKVMADVLVAYAQNGEPVRPDQGFPLRLLVPGYEGIYQVKWLRRIKVVDRPYLTFQEHARFLSPDPRTKYFIYELGPKSVITFPSGEHRLQKHGPYIISGLAWSGGGAVRKVEISTDGGRTWQDAQLQEPVLRLAHTRFQFAWNWNGDEAVLMSRCTDELGQVQPTETEFAAFWKQTPKEIRGASTTRYGHINFIQPWKVARDGGVANALPL